MHDITLALGFIAGALYIASHYMKTMVPLRICEIASNALFVVYGFIYPSYPTLMLYGILVPLNSLRLYEMLQLIKKVRTAASSDLSVDWLKPFMHKRSYKSGDFLFHKNDSATEMFYVVSGTCLVVGLGLRLSSGQLVGELGFLTAEQQRTQSVECVDNVEVLAISYDKVRELYFSNPTFGLYFLNITSRRLLENVARMEREFKAQKHEEAVPGRA
jgi:hypothetical protein